MSVRLPSRGGFRAFVPRKPAQPTQQSNQQSDTQTKAPSAHQQTQNSLTSNAVASSSNIVASSRSAQDYDRSASDQSRTRGPEFSRAGSSAVNAGTAPLLAADPNLPAHAQETPSRPDARQRSVSRSRSIPPSTRPAGPALLQLAAAQGQTKPSKGRIDGRSRPPADRTASPHASVVTNASSRLTPLEVPQQREGLPQAVPRNPDQSSTSQSSNKPTGLPPTVGTIAPPTTYTYLPPTLSAPPVSDDNISPFTADIASLIPSTGPTASSATPVPPAPAEPLSEREILALEAARIVSRICTPPPEPKRRGRPRKSGPLQPGKGKPRRQREPGSQPLPRGRSKSATTTRKDQPRTTVARYEDPQILYAYRSTKRKTNDDSANPDVSVGEPQAKKHRGPRKNPYGSTGVAGTDTDRRTKAYKDRVKRLSVPASYAELDDAVPGQMIGGEIDERAISMRDLVTNSTAGGRVSQRGIDHRARVKVEKKKKDTEKTLYTIADQQRRRSQKRFLQTLRNMSRGERRLELEQNGTSKQQILNEVSSDEEYTEGEDDFVPDRLTPPTTPEVDNGDLPEDENTERLIGDANQHGNMFEGLHYDQVVAGETNGIPAEGTNPNLPFSNLDEDRQEAAELDLSARENADPSNGVGPAWLPSGIPMNDDAEDDEEEIDADAIIASRSVAIDLGNQHEARKRAALQQHDGQEAVETDPADGMINSSSFLKRKRIRSMKWTTEDTDMYYQMLKYFGQNWQAMKAAFPGRTLEQVKHKHRREEKSNPTRVTAAINRRKPADPNLLELLSKTCGFDMATPYNREMGLRNEWKNDFDREREETLGQARSAGMRSMAASLGLQLLEEKSDVGEGDDAMVFHGGGTDGVDQGDGRGAMTLNGTADGDEQAIVAS